LAVGTECRLCVAWQAATFHVGTWLWQVFAYYWRSFFLFVYNVNQSVS